MTSLILFGALYGVAAFVVGLGLSLAFATSGARSFVATAVGVLTVGVLLTIAFLNAPTSAAEAFHDQGEYAGRWLDPVIFVAAMLNVVAWFLGVLFGGLFRRADRGDQAATPYTAASWLLVCVAILGLWSFVEFE
jgi:hypothetical protein